MKRLWIGLLSLGLLAPAPARAEELPTLEFGLGRAARKIIEHLNAKGYRNVGVLKFLLRREGQDKYSDSLGTLNLLLARRLEVALVVKNDPRNPVGIIENASAVAATIPGASHLTPEGLDKLFAADYPLAWGKERVKADALIVGDGVVSRDLRTLTLGIHLIGSDTHKLHTLARAEVVRLSPAHLSETGESFHRGAFTRKAQAGNRTPAAKEVLDAPDRFSDGKAEPAQREQVLLAEAEKVRQGDRPHPAKDDEAPFVLEVLYDGKVQPVEVQGGQARIPEPAEGQKVVLRYTRRDKSDQVYGVVIKVNGENTLFRQKLPDAKCRCWLSYPEEAGKPVELPGFQISDDKLEQFRVASREESKEREVYYGSDVGTIAMTVFPELRGKKSAPVLDYAKKDELLIGRAELPPSQAKPETFAQLQASLYAGVDRGLLVEGGKKEESRIEKIKFRSDPIPAMALTLHYYRK
jgi:hypothetical protein